MCFVAVFYLGAGERTISFCIFAGCASFLACLLPVVDRILWGDPFVSFGLWCQ